MADEYIRREDAIDYIEGFVTMNKYYHPHSKRTTIPIAEAIARINETPSVDVAEIPKTGIGDLSDGYHTFNDLYYQRCILFAMVVNDHKSKSWKTRCHEDGQPCFGGGWFLVTIDTPNGAYGYHYEDKYWDLFECEEIPKAKHWDGYTEKDVTRLFSLPDVQPVVHGEWEENSRTSISERHRQIHYSIYKCSRCNHANGRYKSNFCPNCGADMREAEGE